MKSKFYRTFRQNLRYKDLVGPSLFSNVNVLTRTLFIVKFFMNPFERELELYMIKDFLS